MASGRRPEGYGTVTPYLVVDDALAAIAFYERAFGAVERMRFQTGDGRIGHAEVQIGDSIVKLASEYKEINALSPSTLGSTTVSFVVYVENSDEVFERAVAAGAESVFPVSDQFYGDRSGRVRDPFGHEWVLATRVRDVTAGEIAKRMKELFGGTASSDS